MATAVKSGYGGQGPTLLAVSWTQVIIGTIMVLLRGYAASRINGAWRWDFIWVVLALIMGLASQATLHVAVMNGLGNHARQLTYPQIFESLRWIWYCIFTGLPAVCLAKSSIIALLLQVQGPNAKKRNWALWGMGAFIYIVSIVQICLSVFECRPVAKLWNPTLEGYCPSKRVAGEFSKFQGAVGAVTDFALALWPITIVWHLKTSMKVKVGFCLLMAIGILPSIAVIVRIVLLPKISSGGDPTWDFTHFMYWAVSELWAVIILSSIPPLRPLFLRVFYGIKSSTGSYGNSRITTTKDGTKVNGGQSVALRTIEEAGKKGEGISTRTTTRVVDLEGGSEGDGGSEDGVLVGDSLREIRVEREYIVEEEEEGEKGRGF
ncbi:Hypothetical protein D9617_8g049640 [Elsinoe fawcettii]|nr:Hypothetical protein D9617_8g049640 [Elsinoe fawcettii]